MKQLTFAVILLSLTLSAAIFGFFYAWVCSTMWGLDAADPRVAIGAMQAMNASVRNAVFAPIFFGTPFALAAAAALLLTGRQRRSAAAFAAAAIVYFCLGLVLTNRLQATHQGLHQLGQRFASRLAHQYLGQSRRRYQGSAAGGGAHGTMPLSQPRCY